MKLLSHSLAILLPAAGIAVSASIGGRVLAASNSWNAGSETWDTVTGNWASPSTWTNGEDAVFNNTASGTTITLSSGLTAGSVMIGNGGNNANYTFAGNGLSAASFTVQGDGGNHLGINPAATINNATLNLTGDLGVGRAFLNITGNSTITADRIGGGGMTGISSADWGQITIQDTANITATNGIVGGTTAWGLNLNGGTLTTKGIDYGPHTYLGNTANLRFNGTLVKANQNNASFITVSGGLDGAGPTAPEIQSGGAKIDTNGFDIGIQLALAGTGALTKSGNGILTLSGSANSFNGGVTVNGGTMTLAKAENTDSIAAGNAVTVNSGAILKLGAGGQLHDAITSLTLSAGTLDLGGFVEGINPVLTMNNATITGTAGGFLLSRGGYAGDGTNTINKRLTTRAADPNSGRFDITSGTMTLNAAIFTDTGAAAGISKSGAGTLTITSTGGYAGGTTINSGAIISSAQAITGGDTSLGLATSSNVITINTGGTLTGNTDNWLDNTALASGAANAHSVVINAGGLLKGGLGNMTGLGNVTLNGGTIEVTNGLFAHGWNGSFTLGGDITVSGGAAAQITTSPGAGASANLQMSNGTNGLGGTRTFTVDDVTGSAAPDLVVSATLANGTVVKAGAGTLELAPGATGTGTPVNWIINEGLLLANSALGGGLITVSSGATLGGNGTVGNVEITGGGVLAPGASAGHLTANNLTLNPGSVLNIELGAPTLVQSSGSDFVTVGDVLTLHGTLNILALPGFGAPVAGDAWLIMTSAGGIAGNDMLIGTAPALGDGLSFALDSSSGADVFLTVVPEAGTAGLFGLALLILRRFHGAKTDLSRGE